MSKGNRVLQAKNLKAYYQRRYGGTPQKVWSKAVAPQLGAHNTSAPKPKTTRRTRTAPITRTGIVYMPDAWAGENVLIRNGEVIGPA